MRCFTNLLMEALHQPRFADPRFADDKRHLTFTVQGALPPICQQAQFVLAPDKGSQAMRYRYGLESSSHSAGLYYPEKLDRPLDALKRLRPAIFDHEQPRDEPMRCVGNHHTVRFRNRLHPRSYIGSVSKYARVLAGAATDHHRTRIDANPGGELGPRGVLVEL